jgi:hypothetical protein
MGNRFLLFLLCTLITVSCVSVSTLEIHVLEPADEPLTPEVYRTVLVSRINETENSGRPLPDAGPDTRARHAPAVRLAAMETLYSLAHILNESPGIDYFDSNAVKVELKGAGGNRIPEPIDPESIIDLCREEDADAVISLEFLLVEFHDTILNKPGVKETQWFGYYLGKRSVYFNVFWRAYWGGDGYPVDEFTLNDTLTWEHASFNRETPGNFLPSPDEALMEVSYLAALDYARRIAPYWVEEERSYFSRGNLRIRRASGNIIDNRLDLAEGILLKLLDRRNTHIVAAAWHNLALINELRGDYREALVMARKAYQNRMHPMMADYIETLEERLEKSHELDRQLGRIN